MAVKRTWIIFFSLIFLPDSIAYENIAKDKTANQISDYSDAFPARKAVDGIISQTSINMAITGFSTSVWWYVDLGAPSNIHKITIYYRKENEGLENGYRRRFAGFSLYISNSNYTEKGGFNCTVNSTFPPVVFEAECMRAGRYVTLYNDRPTGVPEDGAILELGEVQVFGCPDAKMYGSECDMKCSNKCRSNFCNILSGSCFSCYDGYDGDGCNQPCLDGTYGENCKNKCSINCVDPKACNKASGNCNGGCNPGWRDEKCVQSCIDGTYGQNCTEFCGNCQQTCNKVNGTCAICAPGYYPPLCKNNCSAGFYGQDCRHNCSWNCKGNETCKFNNGHCPNGCADGWTNDFCNAKCPNGFYGPDCTSKCSENCKNGPVCHHVNGKCDQGCKDGYFGLKCSEACGNCTNNTVCNGETGACSGGCAAGWKTDKCKKQCDVGEYGENCDSTCGNCKNGTTCNIISGHCESGCGPGYLNSLCKTGCVDGMYGEGCLENCSGNCFELEPCNIETGFCDRGCVLGYRSDLCDKACKTGFYGKDCNMQCSWNCIGNETCDFVTGHCPHGCKQGWTESTCTTRMDQTNDDSNTGAIIGGVCSVAVAVAVVIIIVIFFIRRRKPEKEFSDLHHPINEEHSRFEPGGKRKSAPKYQDVATYQNAEGLNAQSRECNSVAEDNGDDTYYNTAPKPAEVYKDIRIDDLHNVIQDMLKNEKAAFIAQYEGIFKGEEHPCIAGKKQENIPKNRFKTTFPYDHSRVILTSSSQQSSDYINANYIENIEGERTYIAAQGPKPNTVVDFWKMVWQEHVQKIVMVTNLKEGAKIKCEQYWPNTGETLKKGDVTIKLHEERHYAFYTIRILKITRNVTKEDRLLYHFHYTQWMDHDVPDSLGLVIFHRHVMKTSVRQKNNLTLVHCSAGIGRTGTYIALDALYRNGKKTGKVNIPVYVKIMRKDRMSMIQNVNQYITVFNALEEAFRSTPHAILRSKFVEEFENQNKPEKPANSKHIRTTFHELRSLKPHYTKNECQAGRDNLDSNYTKSVIPVDKFRCNLYSYSKGRGNYYNAVFMQSYTKRDGLISAQFPLPAQTEDFLRLLHDFESHIVVSVNPLSQIESTSIWMPINHSGLTVGDFNVSLDSQPQTTAHVKSTKVSIKKEGFGSHTLEVFESTSWNTRDQLPADPSPVLELVTQAQKALKSHPDGAIVVLSVDGASKCGAFCAVFNALQQVHLDDEVDIFTIVRQLQIRRPEMFSDMDEYQFCFRAVAEHLNEPPEDYDNIYANC